MTAPFATIPPFGALRTEVFGNGWSSGQADRKTSGPGGTTVKLSEYAAEEGTPQTELGIGTIRGVFATRAGGPNAPPNP